MGNSPDSVARLVAGYPCPIPYPFLHSNPESITSSPHPVWRLSPSSSPRSAKVAA